MSARKRIFKEDILSAGVRVIQKRGAEALTVRNIAGELGCSTQPIYSEFRNLDALKAALLPYAEEKYLRFSFTNYKELALSFLEFAQTQKELFKFLYLRKRKNGEKIIEDVNYDATIALLSKNLEMTETQAKDMHRWMQYYCYTQGVMLATDYRDLSLEEMGKELTELFSIMLRHYKAVKSEEELQNWLEKARNLII